MPKIICKCGEILNYGEIPCALEYCFISDVEYDMIDSFVDSQKLYQKMKSFFKCPVCERIWVFWDGFQCNATEYIKCNK